MQSSSPIQVESAEDSDSLLVFKVNNTLFCTRAELVLSITEPQAIYKVPLTPKTVAGLTIYQGNPVAVYCLRNCLGESANDRKEDGVIIFVKTNTQTIGVWVDEASDIIDVAESAYIEPDDVVKSELIKYYITYDKEILLYLDFEYLDVSRSVQNEKTSFQNLTIVKQQSLNIKSDNSPYSVEQSNLCFDDHIAKNDGSISVSKTVNEDVEEFVTHINKTEINKNERSKLATDITVWASTDVGDRSDDSSITTKVEIDSIRKLDEDVPSIKTDKLSVSYELDASSYEEKSPVINTKVTSEGNHLSKQSSSLKSHIDSVKHRHSERLERSLASSAKHSFAKENRAEIYSKQRSIPHPILHTKQYVQSTVGQQEKSFSNAILSLVAFGLLLIVLMFNVFFEKEMPGKKKETSIAKIETDPFEDREKVPISEIHNPELSNIGTPDIQPSVGLKKQVHKDRAVKTNSVDKSSALNSSAELATAVSANKTQATEKRLTSAKKSLAPVKPAKSASDKPYSDQEGEKQKTVIVELSSDTFQIVVERFKDHRQQLTQRSKHKKPSAEKLSADAKDKGEEIVSQVVDASVSESSNNVVTKLPKPDSSTKDLSNGSNHSTSVVTRENHTDSLSRSRFKEFRYVVTRGDTLWDIAAKFLGDPFKYKLLSEYSHVRDPNWIYPGDVVIIRIKIQ